MITTPLNRLSSNEISAVCVFCLFVFIFYFQLSNLSLVRSATCQFFLPHLQISSQMAAYQLFDYAHCTCPFLYKWRRRQSAPPSNLAMAPLSYLLVGANRPWGSKTFYLGDSAITAKITLELERISECVFLFQRKEKRDD